MSSFHAPRIIPWFCLGLLAIASGCQARPAADAASSPAAASGAPPPVRVVVRPAERKTLVRKIEVPGQVEAYETAPLMAKVTGYVRRVAVDIGDRVRGPQPADGERPAAEGDVLLELDVPELERELTQRNASVAKTRAVVSQSEAAIQLAKAGLASAEALTAEAGFAVEAQAALVARWKSENDRIVQLAAAAAVTQKVADETGSQLQAAEASLRQTQAKVQSAQARCGEAAAAVQQAEADLAASQAEVEVALAEAVRTETMLAFATLRAPFDGVVTARHIHPGHLVRAAGTEPLLVVSRNDPVRVVVQVPEGDALLVRPGSPAALRVPALPGAEFTGQVTRTSEALDPGNRTLRIEIDIANLEGTLKPGIYLQAEVEVANRKDVLTLPRAAILTHDKRTFCLTVDQQSQVVLVPVQLGIQVGTDIEILSGLTGTERIITANVGGFREGQVVQAVTSADSP